MKGGAKTDHAMEPLGTQLRRQRRKLALSLDDVSKLTGISKPYLSLVETNKTKSPPSDEKLKRLEQTLKFPTGSLLVRAHLARTPEDVRSFLQHLLARSSAAATAESTAESSGPRMSLAEIEGPSTLASPALAVGAFPFGGSSGGVGVRLDEAYLSGALQSLVEERTGNAVPVGLTRVPVINKVSAGYPRDFTDLDYPARVADEYIPAPADVQADGTHGDPVLRQRFAARVHGDSMKPRYESGDIVVFSPTPDPRSGDDCFVRLDDGRTTFKRVFFEKDPAGNDVVRLQPLNDKYAPKLIPADRVAGVYKAIWVTRPVGTG